MQKKNYTILVGDANGVDKLIQEFYTSTNYSNVNVYVSGEKVRNNLNHWDLKKITVDKNLKGFEFYSQKDIAMSRDATNGFMIWNGVSRGTLNNIINLRTQNKSVLLYLTFRKTFHLIDEDLKMEKIISSCEEKTQKLYTNLIRKSQKKPIFDSNNNETEAFEQTELDVYPKSFTINKLV